MYTWTRKFNETVYQDSEKYSQSCIQNKTIQNISKRSSHVFDHYRRLFLYSIIFEKPLSLLSELIQIQKLLILAENGLFNVSDVKNIEHINCGIWIIF